MEELQLPVANLDDLISAGRPTDVTGSGNEVIQDDGRKRKFRHLPPSPH